MPEYLAPGVYVEEVSMGAKPIEGVSTSTAAMIGVTERGPVKARMVTSIAEFYRWFGSYVSGSFFPVAVDGFFTNGGKRCFISRVVSGNSTTASVELSSQNYPGSLSENVDSSGEEKSEESPEKEKRSSRRAQASAGKGVCIVEAIGPGSWGNAVELTLAEASLGKRVSGLFKLTVKYRDSVETYDNLSLDKTSRDFYVKKINTFSVLIYVKPISDAHEISTNLVTKLSGGNDGNALTLSDYKGAQKEGEKTGLNALDEIDEISLLCAPNEHDIPQLTGELVSRCENLRDRFAILQSKENDVSVSDLYPSIDSKYAAFYYPWIQIIDPLTMQPLIIPPCGHIAGIFARNDTERGVHKAPANEIIRGIIGPQFTVSKESQDILNPRSVNCLRTFRGRGTMVWGARTTSSDPEWKYVNVRRLFLYLEESIEEGTQWVVFEPNTQNLWARVKQSVSSFLLRVWRDGALMGATPEEAFFVKCDLTTMSQDDISNGRLVMIIGVAPVKPAEFVIFRIGQWTGGADATE